MRDRWFETVAEAQRRARRRLPRPIYMALVAGSERGITLNENTSAFAELGFAPRAADLPGERRQNVTVMGQQSALPVLISPAGAQAVHPEAELAVARAAAARGIPMGLSAFASVAIEDVTAVHPKTFMQVFWAGGRETVAARVDRARRAGAAGLIVTLDWSFSHGRDWGSPQIPERLNVQTMLRFAPHALVRPGWLIDWIRSGRPPDLRVPNLATASGGTAPTFFEAYRDWMQSQPPTWDDLRWLRAEWQGPLMLKGIVRTDDARRAVDIGASAISVSNHGGNNLDATPATIRLLPGVVEAVGGEVEVLLDGGIRRGSDVVKALALGARAVMIGRAYLWGLAAAGQPGVENVLDILRGGIDSALLGVGRASVSELCRDDILVPKGFYDRLGDAAEAATWT
jgi:heme/flavin dehydrogenase (mycofactocin system)